MQTDNSNAYTSSRESARNHTPEDTASSSDYRSLSLYVENILMFCHTSMLSFLSIQ